MAPLPSKEVTTEFRRAYEFSAIAYMHSSQAWLTTSKSTSNFRLMNDWGFITGNAPATQNLFERHSTPTVKPMSCKIKQPIWNQDNVGDLIEVFAQSECRESKLDELLRNILNRTHFPDLVMASLRHKRLSIEKAIAEVVHVVRIFKRTSQSKLKHSISEQNSFTQYVILTIEKAPVDTPPNFLEEIFGPLFWPFHAVYFDSSSPEDSQIREYLRCYSDKPLVRNIPPRRENEASAVRPTSLRYDTLILVGKFANLASILPGEATATTIEVRSRYIITVLMANFSQRFFYNYTRSLDKPSKLHPVFQQSY